MPPSANSQPTVVRSPFVALSDYGDEFNSISYLYSTMHSGVFLEAIVPCLHIHRESTVPLNLNACLYGFYKHGDVNELERANKVRKSDVWYHLNGGYDQPDWQRGAHEESEDDKFLVKVIDKIAQQDGDEASLGGAYDEEDEI
ncbi:hypothetical protein K432DRAFT_405895 [Lepidopterella palustris CBS 459.81]|uniref:Uncharacterized protein n=1 Tax=Lepidopterella palustris CBS 459.81 TaxID=1314670 RepID=A0A8E2E8J6_9PEZI|nr:hypothetical protein K432DRAFT_405895 [Lepidopterella palustris CBS 459.81]